MRIIPAIDIIDGKCVRLTKGDYSTSKIYNQQPIEVAKQLEAHGIRYLHLVDLDGAKAKHPVNYRILEAISSQTSLKVDFGGGIKSQEAIEIAFQSGANQVTVGSTALHEPDLFLSWLSLYGSDKIILGADAKDRKIATQGWLNTSTTDVVDFIVDYVAKGVQYAICTDISKDGMLQGSAQELYREVLAHTSLKLIASGGVHSIDDLQQLAALGCEGAIIGKALYEQHITLQDLQKLC